MIPIGPLLARFKFDEDQGKAAALYLLPIGFANGAATRGLSIEHETPFLMRKQSRICPQKPLSAWGA